MIPAAMAADPNETARKAFGDSTTPPGAPAAARGLPAAATHAELADWWTRAGALVLDQAILFGVAVATGVVLGVLGDGRRAQWAVVAVVAIVWLLYTPVLMARRGERNGQTLGRQAVNIRVVRVDGEPVTLWTGVLRTVIGQDVLGGITLNLYSLFDYLWPLRDARNQALHDKIAKTLVVRATADAPAHAWLPPQVPGA